MKKTKTIPNLSLFFDFMKSAGRIALKNYHGKHTQNYKSEKITDIVTETDLAISDLFARFVKEHFSNLDYIIIDEENIKKLGDKPIDAALKHEWQFVLDPIDGTLTYSLQIPMFGISVGILRNGKPYAGIIYAPVLGEIVYSDGKNAFWITNAFKKSEKIMQLKKQPVDPRALILAAHNRAIYINVRNLSKNDTISGFYSAVVHLLYMATGRGRAYYFNAYVWDMAGSWAALNCMGINFMDYDTGKIIDFSSTSFKEGARVRNLQIVCRPDDFEYMKKITTKL
ncbi:MAG: hypothetical protein LBL75_01810 [Rickettsiales bacterium]|nr:hypothetical protein [Rickettsiales bacterium]